MQGRRIYTEGYGLAAQYIAERLKEWGVKTINPDGTYFQPVKNKGYRVTRNSSVTLALADGAKTFKHGDHVTFSANSGGKQTVNYTGVEFVGYGTAADLQGRDLKDKLVIIVPNLAPQGAGAAGPRSRRGRRPWCWRCARRWSGRDRWRREGRDLASRRRLRHSRRRKPRYCARKLR